MNMPQMQSWMYKERKNGGTDIKNGIYRRNAEVVY